MVLSCALFAALLTQNAPVDDKTADAALDAFKTAYKSQVEADREAAVTKLSETVHARTLSRLVLILNSPDAPAVRIAAAKGIAGFGALKSQALAHLIDAWRPEPKIPAVQTAMIQTMGLLGDPGALPAIHRSLQEKDVSLVKAALAASSEIKHASSIDPLIAFLAKTEKVLKANSGGALSKQLPVGGNSVDNAQSEDFIKNLKDQIDAANKSLQAITAQKFAASTDWQSWWNKNRATFKPVK